MVFSKRTNIVDLDVSGNYLEDEKAINLVVCLEGSKVTDLDLTRNDITLKGLLKIAKLAEKTPLKIIRIRWFYEFHNAEAQQTLNTPDLKIYLKETYPSLVWDWICEGRA